MTLLVAAVAVLVPLTIAPGFLLRFDVTPKIAILLIGVAIAVILASLSRSREPVTGRLPTIARWLVALTLIQAVVLIVATVFSTNWRLSLIGTNWRSFGLVTQLGIAAFAVIVSVAFAGRRERTRFLLRAITLSGMLAAGYGTVQYFGWDPWLRTSSYVIGEGEWAIVRPPSTLGHASYAASFYLFAAFGGITVARGETGRVWRSIGIFAAALCALAIVLSGTRAAMLGLIIGSGSLVIATRPRFTSRAAVTAAICALAVIGFYFSPPGERLRARTRWSMEDPRGGARFLLWRDSLRMATIRPVAGWGPETFSTEFPRAQSPELAKAYPDFYYESPHNIFVDVFISTGIPGLAALAAVCGAGLLAAWQVRQTAPALGAALIASLVAQQFTSFTAATALYFYMTIALLVALACRDQIVIRRSAVSMTAAVLLSGGFLWYAIGIIASDRLLAQVSHALDRGDVKSATDLHRRSRDWQRLHDSSDLWYSRTLAAFAQRSKDVIPATHALHEGFAAAARATQSADDRHNAFYNLASYCSLRNDFAGVEGSLRQAIHSAPNWFKPHWTLAQALTLAGRLEEAQREAVLAVELDNGRHPEVTQTLNEIRGALQRR